jgi:hypothetical protein
MVGKHYENVRDSINK